MNMSMNAPICPEREGRIVCPHCGNTLDEILEVRKEASYMQWQIGYREEAGHYGHYKAGEEIHHDTEQITEYRCPLCDKVIAESEGDLKQLKGSLRSAVASSADG